MPQKRNPDAAELVRGHSGRIIGLLTALMVTMKGLPLAYSKDMQDDKQPVFEAHDLLDAVARGDGRDGRDGRVRPRADARGGRAGYPTATDLADWLVREADVPFREAHHITGRAVKAGGGTRRAISLSCRSTCCRAIDARIDERVFDVLGVDASVRSRTSYGGTAPDRVREQIAAAKKELNSSPRT